MQNKRVPSQTVRRSKVLATAVSAISPAKKYKQAEVAALEGLTKRSLYTHIRANKFPAPDFPAHGPGESNKWLGATILRAREDQKRGQLSD
jgi:hypothetical protein